MLAAKVAGATTTEIARQEGLNRDWVRQELASNECQQIIICLVQRRITDVERLFGLALKAVEDGLNADSYVHYQGAVVRLGVDHYARLTAVKRFLELVSLGRPTAKPKSESDKPMITYEDLVRIVEERNKTNPEEQVN